MTRQKRLRVAVLFGGRSVEHEISVITALQLMLAMDTTRFEPVPVYIAPNGSWHTGDALFQRTFYAKVPGNLATLEEVTLLPKPGIGGLMRVAQPSFPQSILPGHAPIIPIDLYMPVFHGQFGEDGCIQGLLELANVPYTGCNVPASAITMNKYVTKMYLQAHGIPVLPAMLVQRGEAQRDLNGILRAVVSDPGFPGFPLFIKPLNLGSSIGVSRASSEQELAVALAKVFRYDTVAMVEPCVSELMEINVSVRESNGVQASVVEIPVSESGILSYEEKYLRDGGKKTGPSQGMASLTRIIDPVDLDPVIKESVISHATNAFSLLGCSGVARLDFIYDLAADQLYFNELNAFPGSCAFYLWAKSQPRVLYTELITDMISTALHHYGENASLERSIGLKALKG